VNRWQSEDGAFCSITIMFVARHYRPTANGQLYGLDRPPSHPVSRNQ